jgi:hypothetical protein
VNLPPWTDQLFAAIDRRDADAFANLLELADDRIARYGIFIDISALHR